MFGIAQRYLAATFIPPFMLSTLFFVAFLLTFQLFRVVRIVINKGVEFSTVLELTGHIAISFLPMAIPLSALFATIYTLNKMSEDSEIVAMRSFGLTKGKLFLPLLILGLIASIGIFSLNMDLIPRSKTQFKNTIVRLTSRGMLTDIKAENFFTEIPNVTLFAEKVDEGGNLMENVFIHIHKNHEEQVIVAKAGALIKQYNGSWDIPSIRMHLTDGTITKTKKSSGDSENIIFDEYDFPILSNDYTPGFVTKDSMRTSRELRKRVRIEKNKMNDLLKRGNLTQEEKNWVHNMKRGLPKSELEYWSRMNTPLQTLVFILLGFALGIKQGRGKSRNSGLISLVILIGYYAIFFTGVSLVKKGQLPASLVVFLPTAIAGFVAAYYYKKLDWQS
ncbi:MAG: LptF/LptG family permease [Bacteriovoracaceae bacterium]|nr:LptF/LptG family permease [Bacteriovoracaceae bacterium]